MLEDKVEPTRIACIQCGTVYRVYRSPADLENVRVKCKKCCAIFTPTFPASKGPENLSSPEVGADSTPFSSKISPESSEKIGGGFSLLEDMVGNLSRSMFEVRQSSPDSIPDAIWNRVADLADSLVDVKREVNGLCRSARDLETLLEVSRVLNQERDLDSLLNRIMDYAIEMLNAERGFLMMKNPASGALEVSVARGMGEDLTDDEAREFSTGIASQVAAEGDPFFTPNSKGDDRVMGFASVMRSEAPAILCVPISYKDRNLGTVYIDNKSGAPGFTKELVPLALSFAGTAAGAIENARLYENISEETSKRTSLARYLSPAIVDDILRQGDEWFLGGQTVECSILFTDVAGFTHSANVLSRMN